LAAHQNW